MKESFPPQNEKSVEKQANFEGSWTNVMIERLNNPEIKKQIIDLLYEIEQAADGEEIKIPMKDSSGKNGWRTERHVALTREEVEKDLKKRMEMVAKETPISFSSDMPNGEEINMNWVDEKTGQKPTVKGLNIIESHEKGHVLRPYGTSWVGPRKNEYPNRYYLSKKFYKAFDFSKIELSHDEYELGKLKTPEKIKAIISEYLQRPQELAERMSQLKNYFGMNDDEKFTKEHLSYAREHYIEDTNLDNEMTQFFQAITPEKEEAFLELINSAGI